MGTKIRERATGAVWTIVGDNEGHSILQQGDEAPTERPKSYRIRSESTGEERLISSDLHARFESMS
ncbi:MAG: hypothetical protein ACO1SV_15060 [Fimbriimonas sp.]